MRELALVMLAWITVSVSAKPSLPPPSKIGYLDVMRFSTADGQISTAFVCHDHDRDAKIRKCLLLQSVYTVEPGFVVGRTKEEIDKKYKDASKQELITESRFYCEQKVQFEMALKNRDLAQSIANDLKDRLSFAQKSCGCQNEKDQAKCLRALQVPSEPTDLCTVDSIATSYTMTRQKNGSWKGVVDHEKGEDNYCATNAEIEISFDQSYGANSEFYSMAWRPHKSAVEGAGTLSCRMLERPLTLRPNQSAKVPMACKYLTHSAG